MGRDSPIHELIVLWHQGETAHIPSPSWGVVVISQSYTHTGTTTLRFLQLIVVRTPPSFLGLATIGLEYGGVECWIRPAARYWSKAASAFLARMELILQGREATGALSGGTVIFNGISEHEPKSVFEVEKTSRNSQRASPSRTVEAEVDVA